jgi:hypothetical protein
LVLVSMRVDDEGGGVVHLPRRRGGAGRHRAISGRGIILPSNQPGIRGSKD